MKDLGHNASHFAICVVPSPNNCSGHALAMESGILRAVMAWIAFIFNTYAGIECYVGEGAAPHHPRVLLFCSHQLG